MTPLIDVVFLLLTFFVFALVLTVRIDVTDITLPQGGAGAPAEPRTLVVVGLDAAGDARLDGTATPIASLPAAIAARLAERPGAPVVVAPDRRAPPGAIREHVGAHEAAGVPDLRFLREPRTGSGP